MSDDYDDYDYYEERKERERKLLEERFEEAKEEYHADLEKYREQLGEVIEVPQSVLQDRSYEAEQNLEVGIYLMTQELYDWTMEVIGEDNEGYMQSDSIGKHVYFDGEFFCNYAIVKGQLEELGTLETFFTKGYYDESPYYEAILELIDY